MQDLFVLKGKELREVELANMECLHGVSREFAASARGAVRRRKGVAEDSNDEWQYTEKYSQC